MVHKVLQYKGLHKHASRFFLHKIITVIFAAVALFLVSCDRDVMFEQNIRIPESVWNLQDSLSFSVEISDTVSLHNMYVNIRNTTDYPFSNFFMFLDIRFPDGQLIRDTLEMELADRTGNWTGRGMGHIKANRFLFRTGVWFPQIGTYTLTMQQAMRIDALPGVSDIGLRITKE